MTIHPEVLREVLAEVAARHRPTVAVIQAALRNVDMEAKK